MKSSVPASLLLGLSFLLFNACSAAVTFTVVNTRDEPVPGVHITATAHEGPQHVVTNDEGKATMRGDFGSSFPVRMYRKDYYTSFGNLWRGGLISDGAGGLKRRVMPSAFSITLKKVRNPVPMRHLRFKAHAPIAEEPLGYDLLRMDWIAPYGYGNRADFYLEFLPPASEDAPGAGRLRITFPHPRDGIQEFTAPRPWSYTEFGSNLVPPHVAPVDGYRNELTQVGNLFQPGHAREDNRHYLLRTRSETDASGKLVKACYTWIQAGFRFYVNEPYAPQLAFDYYMNPNPDPDARSLEPHRVAELNKRKRPDPEKRP